MAAKISPYLDYILNDVMADVPGITYKAMFGGYGLYKRDVFFAIIAYDTLYFKVNDETKKKYQDHGSSPFVYEGKGKSIQMSYWEVPESIMEDSKLLNQWITEACKVYLHSKKDSSKRVRSSS